MLSKLGLSVPPAVDYLVAFVVIFAVLALAAFALRRMTTGRLTMPGQERGRGRQPRLGVVDVYDLDRQRQLILLRRDNVEHLLLIGGPNDVVIETNIVRVAGARLPAPVGEPAPERLEPALEAGPPSAIEPARGVGPATSLAGVLNDGAEARAPNRLRPPAPSARVEPALKPDTVSPAPEPPKPAGLGTDEGKAPEPAGPPPGGAARRAPQPPPAARLRAVEAEPRPAPPRLAPLRPELRPPAPEQTPQPIRRDPAEADAAVLSDMARQLEQALRQPSRPVPAAKAGTSQHDEPAAPAPGPPPQASAPPSAPLPSQPAHPRPAPPRPPRPEPAAEPAPAPPASRVDPFSVEEIEAEFARLLGRPLDKSEKK